MESLPFMQSLPLLALLTLFRQYMLGVPAVHHHALDRVSAAVALQNDPAAEAVSTPRPTGSVFVSSKRSLMASALCLGERKPECSAV